mmetsp:Transcript_22887/g.56505  ORF Transcript_22887/g.56505 Transcript_22887/m.56505 type:complete len:213 (+) Transcript_22887:394-1032(+)
MSSSFFFCCSLTSISWSCIRWFESSSTCSLKSSSAILRALILHSSSFSDSLLSTLCISFSMSRILFCRVWLFPYEKDSRCGFFFRFCISPDLSSSWRFAISFSLSRSCSAMLTTRSCAVLLAFSSLCAFACICCSLCLSASTSMLSTSFRASETCAAAVCALCCALSPLMSRSDDSDMIDPARERINLVPAMGVAPRDHTPLGTRPERCAKI